MIDVLIVEDEQLIADAHQTYLQRLQGFSVAAVAQAVRDAMRAAADQVGVSRVTAWRYLERLADEGTVRRHTDYGRAGRPKTRYQWR